MLTRDENWINRADFVEGFESIPPAISDSSLRASIFNYFQLELHRRVREEAHQPVSRGHRRRRKERQPTRQDRISAISLTMRRFPEILDYYIRMKENSGDNAKKISEERVISVEYMFIQQLQEIQTVLSAETEFYKIGSNTYEEAHARLDYLKDVIENKGGHRFFYGDDGEPIEREKDLHVLYRLVWFGTPSDAGAEANDGRGPVDFKISRGRDKTLVEMKLAKNSKLEQNLAKQAEIYQAASDAKHAIKAIVYFSVDEFVRVKTIVKRLGLEGNRDVVLIDARRDNKPSGSKAR